jgi:hypothetical protein
MSVTTGLNNTEDNEPPKDMPVESQPNAKDSTPVDVKDLLGQANPPTPGS